MAVDFLLSLFDDNGHPENITEKLDDKDLQLIASKVLNGYTIDENSRSNWKSVIDKAMKVAKQDFETKTYPWENASNVRFPLIPVGCISYASHSYPEIIRNGKVLDCAVFGEDPEGQKNARAKRISDHMNYQLLCEDEYWEVDQDRLSHVLPLIGHVFKKVYYNPILKRNCSELCLPDKIVVNNNIKSIESARRVTHVISMYWNDIYERILSGSYRDIPKDKIQSYTSVDGSGDEDPIHEVLEQHCYLDLDDDGYDEPYIVLLHKQSNEVLAIYPRFYIEDIELKSDKKTVKKIKPRCYFVDFVYIPSPDGTYYGLGLGVLLYPINDAVNSIMNQLIDSGTLSNLQGGFVTRDLKIRGGSLEFTPGEWKVIDSGTIDDLGRAFFSPPFKEPSPVLLQLLDVLIKAGKELSTVTDVSTGNMPGQNVPATTAAILESGSMKMFSAAQRRMIKSLDKEFKKWYDLNKRYLDPLTYYRFNDTLGQVSNDDYAYDDMDVKPVADPSLSSQSQRMQRTQSLMGLIGSPLVNSFEILKRFLEELEIPNPEAILTPPEAQQPAPNPDMIRLELDQKKMMIDAEQKGMDQRIKMAEIGLREMEVQIKAAESGAKVEKLRADAITDLHYAGLDAKKVDLERIKKMAEMKQAEAGRKVVQTTKK